MKKTITLLLTLCLLLGLLPVEAAAFAGDIYRAGDVKQVKMADGSLSLQNGYVHVTLHKLLETYSYLTVVPAAKRGTGRFCFLKGALPFSFHRGNGKGGKPEGGAMLG